jgi:SAM-dependent methyltransferase
MKLPIIDIRHERIIKEAIEVEPKTILNVGSGHCKPDAHLNHLGFKVYSTDYFGFDDNKKFIKEMESFKDIIDYYNSDIFDLSTFPIKSADVVICSETLEHLVEYKKAFDNLMLLTNKRLIITVPWKHSYNEPSPPPMGHANWWDDTEVPGKYTDINEFRNFTNHKTKIVKILTKERDIQMGQADYLIIIDKI